MNRIVGALLLVMLLVGCAVPTAPSPTPVAPLPTATLVSPTVVTTPATSSPTSTAAGLTPAPTAIALTPPKIISFTVAPTTTAALDTEIFLAWAAVGERAEICPITASGPLACQSVPLQGTLTLVSKAESATYTALGLRVTTGTTFEWSMVSVNFCNELYAWFFANPPARCPSAAPLTSAAAAQTFEHGFMLWVAATDTFYIFYQDPQTVEQLMGPLQLEPGATVDNRVGETPPAGYVEPVSGFGLIWRDEVVGLTGVRQRLGWATAPEFEFNTTHQCEAVAHPHLWNCYLHGPAAQVLHFYPDSSAQVQLFWEEHH